MAARSGSGSRSLAGPRLTDSPAPGARASYSRRQRRPRAAPPTAHAPSARAAGARGRPGSRRLRVFRAAPRGAARRRAGGRPNVGAGEGAGRGGPPSSAGSPPRALLSSFPSAPVPPSSSHARAPAAPTLLAPLPSPLRGRRAERPPARDRQEPRVPAAGSAQLAARFSVRPARALALLPFAHRAFPFSIFPDPSVFGAHHARVLSAPVN